MKKYFFLGCALFMAFFSGLYAQSIIINEVVTSNSSVNPDDDGTYQDWIELYNSSDEAVNLDGYGLSDDETLLFKWTFPSIELASGQHLLVWCSDKNRSDPQFPLHTNFKLNADGETISITKPSGVISDVLPPVIIEQNHSYGRTPSGGAAFTEFPVPTPAAENGSASSEQMSAPVFSVDSGNYSSNFYLTLSHTDPQATILYTLDGSEPDAANIGGKSYVYKNQYAELPGQQPGEELTKTMETFAYSGPIDIHDRSAEPNDLAEISTTYESDPDYLPAQPLIKSTSVRAIAVKESAQPSDIETKNYFVGSAANHFTIPVVSINVNADAFLGYESGIHVPGKLYDEWREDFPQDEAVTSNNNYIQKGDAWEIKGNLSYFVEGSPVLSQDVGIRIHGGMTRNFPNKSLRIYARSQYGNANLNYPFFSDDPDDEFQTLILRNSGNDTSTSYFLDAFIHRSVKHMHFETQSYAPSQVFINGEYWGMLNWRERYDDKYFDRVYNIDEDELDYLEIGGGVITDTGDTEHYNSMVDFAFNNSLADDANYQYIITQLDPESFADYFLTEIYVANIDWPSNNQELFRKRTSFDPNAAYGTDGRWRWILKDTDVGLNLATPATHNTLAFATEENGPPYPNPAWSTLLLRKMLENEGFKNYFISRFADMMNTTFLPDRMQGIFDEMKAKIAPEIQFQINRWVAMGSVGTWNNYCSAIISFAYDRPFYQRQHIREKFSIASNVDVSVNVNNHDFGYVKVNTIDILPSTPGVSSDPYPWQGIYFQGIPVKFEATPLPGYIFSHWSGASNATAAVIEISPIGDLELTAHFIPDTNPELPMSVWLASSDLENDTPFETINSTYEIAAEGWLEYQSALPGYPYAEGDDLWRTASLERVNSPTDINYIPLANNDIPFESANMRGLQVRQPFQADDLENTLIFHQSTASYKDIHLRFASYDDGAASGLMIDYSTDSITWTTASLPQSAFELSSEYQLFDVDFSGITAVNNNPNFKIRIRFTGENMEADNGDRVIFNNFSISGRNILNTSDLERFTINLYPNPVSDVLNISQNYDGLTYKIFSLEGRMVSGGNVNELQIPMQKLSDGMYIVQLSLQDQVVKTQKIIKK